MKLKKRAVITFLASMSSAVIGDYSNLMDKAVYPLVYRRPKSGCQKPFELQKKYVVNDKGFLEVYIGYDRTYYKVEDGIRVNERPLDEMLKDEIMEVYNGTKKWYESVGDIANSFIEWYAETESVEKEKVGGVKNGQ